MAVLPAIGIGLTAASTLLGGVSQAEAASYQGKVASNNAKTAANNAAYAAQSTASRTEQEGLKAASRAGNVTAGLAANGVDVSTGSPAAVQQSDRELGLLDVANTASEGARQVYGYEVQQRDYGAQSALDQSEVGSDIVGSVLKAGGAAASSAGELGGGDGLPGWAKSADSQFSSNASSFTGTADASILSSAPSLPKLYQGYGGNPTTSDWDM